MNTVKTENTRIYSLDILKILATVCIILHHYQQITGAWFEGSVNFFNGRFYFGYMVELFFILSGLFMTRYVQKIKSGLTFKSFYLKRALRLLPVVAGAAIGYELLLTVYVKILGMNWMDRMPSIWGMVIDSLGLQAGWVFDNPYVNNPTWYIAVLLLCYAVFYLITWISGRIRISSRYMYVFMILLGCGIRTYKINLPFLNEYTCRGYYAFFTGVLLGSYIIGRSISKRELYAGLLICVCMIACLIWGYSMVSGDLQYVLTFVFYPALVIVCLSDPVRKLFASSFWGKWGEISFDAYVWHVPVLLGINVAGSIFSVGINFAQRKNMFLYLLVTEAVGIASYVIIEKWIVKMIKGKKTEMEIGNIS